jgi:hypothetical protein
MSNKNFQNGENEILSRDEARVRELLGNLERVDAPKDFDFKLKARIANAEPNDYKPRLFSFLRRAAPLGLAILILAMVVVSGLYSFDNNSVPSIASNSAANPVVNPSLPDNSQPKEEFVAASNSTTANLEKPEAVSFAANTELTEKSKKPKIQNRNTDNNGGGSKDFSFTPKSPILPPGLNPDKEVEIPKDFKNLNSDTSVKDILSIIGIEASFEKNRWKVNSVKQNSRAERSGVKANDVIEAIDENRLATETISTKNVNGNKLTVVRGGEKLEIKLQEK